MAKPYHDATTVPILPGCLIAYFKKFPNVPCRAAFQKIYPARPAPDTPAATFPNMVCPSAPKNLSPAPFLIEVHTDFLGIPKYCGLLSVPHSCLLQRRQIEHCISIPRPTSPIQVAIHSRTTGQEFFHSAAFSIFLISFLCSSMSAILENPVSPPFIMN